LLLQVEGLNAHYGDVQVLFDVSFEVAEGELVSMVGANSAGKSTLLRCLSGMLKKVSGSINFDGHELIGTPAYNMVNQGIIHIPEGRRVFPMMTVEENLQIGGYSKRKDGEMADLIARSYDMFPRLKRLRHQMAGSMSGGEQQMLAIARGLMAKPRLLTVDEPSLGLAPILVDDTFRILERIKTSGVTILLVEQNVVRALKMSDRAYVIENGRIVMQGQGATLLKDDHLRKAYMGM
jgi:branched-chain amino acid transport system ATP-binding protein